MTLYRLKNSFVRTLRGRAGKGLILVFVLLAAGGIFLYTAQGAAGQRAGALEKTRAVQAAPEGGEAGAGTAAAGTEQAESSVDREITGALRELPILMALQDHPRPGEPITVIYVPREDRIDADFKAVLSRSGRAISRGVFFEYCRTAEGRLVSAALLTVPSTLEPGDALIYVEGAGGMRGTRRISVEHRDFVSELIPLNESNTALRTVPDPRKTREAELLWSIITSTGAVIYAEGPFSAPVSSTRRTSFFGDRRVYQYSNGRSDSSVHAGIDYGVPTGTEVLACAPGRVVLAVFRIVTGNTVIIEHLPGVYSLYYHLDRILIEEGTLAERGTLLGKSGATGLATGPHLHWEIRVGGENTDPDAVMLRPLLDKDLILSKIRAWADSETARNSYRSAEGR